MMNLLLLATFMPGASFAFIMAPVGTTLRSNVMSGALFAEGVDSSEEIEKAMEATEKFGATSPEARVLWDAVEEMDASSENKEVSKPGLDTECELDEDGELSAACADYDSKMAELKELMSQYDDKLIRLKTLTSDLSQLKMTANAGFKKKWEGSNISPELQASIEEAFEAAKKASAEFGASSNEAKLAWEAAEELASSKDLDEAMIAGLDKECLVEQASEACETLEKFNVALKAYQES